MSKSVLIVEKDLALMKQLREGLQAQSFEVEETTDGKGAPELIRSKRPECVVLAVDLDAGQNGYIICKKLKSDDDLKSVPIIIVGDPKGFAQHQKLKTRAEEYLGKPVTPDELVACVGKLIGYPEVASFEAPVDESFDAGSLLEEDSAALPLETPIAEETNPEADLAMVDSMFDEKPAELEPVAVEEDISLMGSEPEEYPVEKTLVGLMPPVPPAPVKTFSSSVSSVESSELRSKVTELTGALDEARSKNDELEARVRQLESDLETKSTELETAKATPAKSDSKDVFALREAGTKKDKEILRLKNELNAKEQELIEVQEKQNTIEQQLADSGGDMAKKDAQLKTLQTRADQLTADKRKGDQALATAKEEARSANAKLQTLQTDFEQLQARVTELEGEVELTRAGQHEAEASKSALESELVDVRSQLDTAQAQTATVNDELSGLRQRLAEVEAEGKRAEDKATRASSRLRAHQDQLDRLRGTLQSAMDTLSESASESDVDLDIDDVAEA